MVAVVVKDKVVFVVFELPGRVRSSWWRSEQAEPVRILGFAAAEAETRNRR